MEVFLIYFIIGFFVALLYSVISGILDASSYLPDFEFGFVVVSFFVWPIFIFCMFFVAVYNVSMYITGNIVKQHSKNDKYFGTDFIVYKDEKNENP